MRDGGKAATACTCVYGKRNIPAIKSVESEEVVSADGEHMD
jgi:hypothetical protein